MQAQISRVTNELASSKGLPSYEQFHQDYGVAYNLPPEQADLGIAYMEMA